MKRFILPVFVGMALVAGTLPDTQLGATLQPADNAPEFTLTDTYDQQHTLSDYEGQWVVLEWLNYDCPFVRKHYNGDNMQALQEQYTGAGVVWLSIVSSAPGQQGNFSNEEMNARTAEHGGHQTAVLIDADGTVGHAYGALTTPHMFVIDKEGVIRYTGAIDDNRLLHKRPEEITNYVVNAVKQLVEGETLTPNSTKPYGCTIKYSR